MSFPAFFRINFNGLRRTIITIHVAKSLAGLRIYMTLTLAPTVPSCGLYFAVPGLHHKSCIPITSAFLGKRRLRSKFWHIHVISLLVFLLSFGYSKTLSWSKAHFATIAPITMAPAVRGFSISIDDNLLKNNPIGLVNLLCHSFQFRLLRRIIRQ